MKCLVPILFACGVVAAQESRGLLLGRVTDSSDAIVPGAKVTAVNVATNAAFSSTSNQEGNYEIPYLIPGLYRVTAELDGFSRAVRDGIEVRVSDRLALDFLLKVGSLADSVVVTGETPLLQTATASLGMVMDSKRASELPIIGGNAFYLTRLSAGVNVTGGHSAGNPMDRGAASSNVIVNGTRSANSEVTLDGVPNMQEQNTAFSPPQDLVQEFKVETTSYDATLGHAAGAVVNVSLKSGTNQLHGTGYYFDSRVRAVPWFSNNFLYNPATGPINDQKRLQANPGWLHQRWGATLSGPVVIPKVYNGKNRTFWTFGYEGVQIDRQPTFFATVPGLDQRRGDFSALLKLGTQYQIYDPATIAAAPNGRFSRQPLAGNIVPASRLSPIALNTLKFYPEPNVAGTSDGRQNYFGVQKEPKLYKGFISRIDHTFSEKHRLFFRLSSSDYVTSLQTLPTEALGTQTIQISKSLMVDDVYVIDPTLLLNVRAGITYFNNNVEPFSRGFDLTSLGLPASLVNQLATRNNFEGVAFPNVLLDGGAYTELNPNSVNSRKTPYYSFLATVTKTLGDHSFRFGTDFRILQETGFDFGKVGPRIEVSNAWARGPLDNVAGAPVGQGLASFLLGYPTGGSINNNASRAQQSKYWALFLQDDWKLSRKLTVNVGLRWDYESPTTERYNRSIRGYDFETASPIQAQAQAAYGRNPIPQVSPSQFRTLGGLTFAGVDDQSRGLWRGDRNNFSPRIGIAYQLAKRTVIRTGYGIFFATIGADRRDVNQGGFNQPTNLQPSLDNGLTFRATLADPFPDGIEVPAGASQGLRTFLGRGVTFFQGEPRTPYMQRWSFSVQQELPGRTLIDVTYVGNRGTNLSADRNYNPVPNSYLSTSPVRDQATIDFLTTQVVNPFFGIADFAGTGLAANRVARQQLLRPFPQFQDITASTTLGYSWYHSLQVNAQRRFANGLTFQASWTWSKFMEAIGFLNPGDLRPERVISDQDFPHRVTISGIYELPFGRGKKIAGGANRWVNGFIGGWQLQAWFEGQSGEALGFGNVAFAGDLHDIVLPVGRRTISRWFNVDAGFERSNARALANNLRTLSTRFTGIRGDGINNMDASLFKNFPIGEHHRIQFRFETYNSLNHAQFGNPNTTPTNTAFGTVTAEKGHGQRQLTLALKWLF